MRNSPADTKAVRQEGGDMLQALKQRFPCNLPPEGAEMTYDESQPQQEIPYFGSPSFKKVKILSAMHKTEA